MAWLLVTADSTLDHAGTGDVPNEHVLYLRQGGLCASLCGHHRECGRGPSNCQTPPSRRGSLNHAHFSLNFLLHGIVLKYLRKSKHTIQQPGVISRTAESTPSYLKGQRLNASFSPHDVASVKIRVFGGSPSAGHPAAPVGP